ncbi:BRCT domain protein [Aspergillus novofumigatus IBT 16806]|uniref:NAD(+) ADP-ribosyltransferase n=1 Tax=Aspergillus novofumigatus (strain IBT 16806) TaxID=1392255 RepID=A0A2I1C8U0_ASPN1|nr:BRCT domain protein [Aspergillus novofumigatus IBT 16806]PKX94057.1 BRCT domain protein [Aspergillus novofumigatus IBT 16806]
MGKTFKNIHACAIGRFPVNGDKIQQWIRAHGGTFSKDVTEDVTHLITTTETFEKNVEADGTVQKAKLLETVKIVTYGWLEDSLQSKLRKPKPEGAYLLANLPNKDKKKQRRAAKVQTRQLKAKDKSSAPMLQDIDCSQAPGNDSSNPKSRTRKGKALTADSIKYQANYHVYVEQGTGETYSATIYRQLSRNNTREKFQIKVHESNDMPHTYATQAKYSRTGKSIDEMLAPPGSDQDSAIAAFRDFFAAKTGKNWENRLDGFPMPPKKDVDGKELPVHEGWFYYETGRSLLSIFLRQGETRSCAAGQGAEQIAVGSNSDDHGLLTPPGIKDGSVVDQP